MLSYFILCHPRLGQLLGQIPILGQVENEKPSNIKGFEVLKCR